MPKTLIINNTPYEYPSKGDEPGWGGPATGWAEGVTDVLNSVVGPDDILQTSFSIANLQVAATDVVGLVFNTGSVQSAVVEYSVHRTSSTTTGGKTESGTMHLNYNTVDGWLLGQGGVIGTSEVIFTITSSGQIQYTSSDIGSIDYVGTMKFTGKALYTVHFLATDPSRSYILIVTSFL